MLLENTPKIVFYGGKGGVGKTTLAAATATGLAQQGKKVLLISTDPAHNIGHLFHQQVHATPTPIDGVPGLQAVEIDPQATTEAHIDNVRHTMRRMLPEHLHRDINKHLDLAKDAPGTHEAAILERLAQLITRADHDHIIIDTAPSGHTTRLVALPELMAAWTEGLLKSRDKSHKLSRAVRGLEGRDASVVGTTDEEALDPIDRRDKELRRILHARRELFTRLRGMLHDPDTTTFRIVLHAERMPVLESLELYQQLTSTGMRVDCFIINRLSPRDQGDFLARRRAAEDTFITQLTHTHPDVPTLTLPLFDGDVTGVEGLKHILGATAVAGGPPHQTAQQ